MLPEMRPGSSRTLVRTHNVHLHDEIPILIFHVFKADVTQDSSVVDQDVDPAVSLDSRLNDLVSILDRVVVGRGLAAGGGDLVDNCVGGLQSPG